MNKIILVFLLYLFQSNDLNLALNELKATYPKQLGKKNEIGITILSTDACLNCCLTKLISHLEKISFFEKEKTVLLIPNKSKLELAKYLNEELGLSQELQENLIIISDSKMVSNFRNNMTTDGGEIFYLRYKNNNLERTVPFGKLGKAEYYTISKNQKKQVNYTKQIKLAT